MFSQRISSVKSGNLELNPLFSRPEDFGLRLGKPSSERRNAAGAVQRPRVFTLNMSRFDTKVVRFIQEKQRGLVFHSPATDLQQQTQKLADFQWISALILAGGTFRGTVCLPDTASLPHRTSVEINQDVGGVTFSCTCPGFTCLSIARPLPAASGPVLKHLRPPFIDRLKAGKG